MTVTPISTKQEYSLNLTDDDVFAFSISVHESQDLAQMEVAAHKFPDLDPLDEPKLKVRFQSGQELEFDVEDAELVQRHNRTNLRITATPAAFRVLDKCRSHYIVYATMTKLQHQEWQRDVEGLDANMSFLFSESRPGCEYVVYPRRADREKPWTNVEIIKHVCKLHGINCVVTQFATEQKKDAEGHYPPTMFDWDANIWSIAKDLFPSDVWVYFDALSKVLYVREMYEKGVGKLSIDESPQCDIKRAHPLIEEEAMFELLGGMVDFRRDKFKWGKTYTQQLDPKWAGLPIQNEYVRELMSGGVRLPEDFFTMSDVFLIDGYDKNSVEGRLSSKTRGRRQQLRSDAKDLLSESMLKLLKRLQDKPVWNATRPFYFHKLVEQGSLPQAGAKGMSKTRVWRGCNSIGEDGWDVFKQVFTYVNDDPANPKTSTGKAQEGLILMDLAETVYFYEGITEQCKAPRCKCEVTVHGHRMIQFRSPKGSSERESDRYGNRAKYFNSSAAPEGWVPMWVWEPNAKCSIRARVWDEDDYPLFDVAQTWAITFEPSGQPGNEAADELNEGAGGTFVPSGIGSYNQGAGGTYTLSEEELMQGVAVGGKDGQSLKPEGQLQMLETVLQPDQYDATATYHWQIFTHGKWTQDSSCLIGAVKFMFVPLDLKHTLFVSTQSWLTGGRLLTYPPDVQTVPYNSIKKDKIIKIRHPCYYDKNWPDKKAKFSIKPVGLKETLEHLLDWDKVERVGERKWQQATEPQFSYALEIPGSVLVLKQTGIQFTTARREFMTGGIKKVLEAMSYDVCLTDFILEKSGPNTLARTTLAARDFIEQKSEGGLFGGGS